MTGTFEGGAVAGDTDPAGVDPSVGGARRAVADVGAELDRVEATLAAVVAALARLDEGRYHRCGRCGAPLDPARLAADPLIEHCPDRCVAAS